MNVAIAHVLHGKPDLIVSGINKGWNLGDDVTYSGTVSGALEGALLGIRSLAVSTHNKGNRFDFGPAAKAAAAIAGIVLDRGMPKFTLLNINVPFGPNKGFRTTVQAKRNHVTMVSKRLDPRNRPYYWIEEGENQWEPHDRSDYEAVREGYISITPLHPDMTAHDVLQYVDGLSLVSPAEGTVDWLVRRGVAQPGRALGSGRRNPSLHFLAFRDFPRRSSFLLWVMDGHGRPFSGVSGVKSLC